MPRTPGIKETKPRAKGGGAKPKRPTGPASERMSLRLTPDEMRVVKARGGARYLLDLLYEKLAQEGPTREDGTPLTQEEWEQL